MDTIDKIYFIFCIYDFEQSGSLSFDEATLLLRSVVQGLSKVCPSNLTFTTPISKDIEQYTELIFNYANKNTNGSCDRITTVDFKLYCTQHPIINSWLKTVAQFPTTTNTITPILNTEIGNIQVLSGPCYNNIQNNAKNFTKTASIISETEYLSITAVKEKEERDRLEKPKHSIIKTDEGDEEEADEEGR